MKKIILSLAIIAVPAFLVAQYNSLVHFSQGASELVVESGGTLSVESGATLNVKSGATLTTSAAISAPSVAVTAGAFTPYARTKAQLEASTPSAVGQVYYESTTKVLVVSTGTSLANFGRVDGSTW